MDLWLIPRHRFPNFLYILCFMKSFRCSLGSFSSFSTNLLSREDETHPLLANIEAIYKQKTLFEVDGVR
jgi:hypothetical protein